MLSYARGLTTPPPGVDGSIRLGGCDAQARKQAQQDGHHRQGAAQTGNQMHQTKPLHQMPSGANAACIIKFFLSESHAPYQRQACITSQELMA